MLADANTVPRNSVIEADVCVVGGGTAGLAIAVELIGSGLDVVLLESGGLAREAATDQLNVGESDGIPYSPLESCRSRFLGGSTNCWGGWSRPFEEEDFAVRPWVRESGWPIGFGEVEGYYQRATELLLLGQHDYDPDRFQQEIGGSRGRLVRLEGDRMKTHVLRFSPPARFGELYRARLERAHNVRCLLHANVVAIETDADAVRAKGVRVATLAGNTLRVRARATVLAAGGIENPRLLLLSDDVRAAGLGNDNDLVGRYFMDHPTFLSGRLHTGPQAPALDLYDDSLSFHDPTLAVNGVSVAAYFAVARTVCEQEGLLRHRLLFHTTYVGEDSAGTEALRRLTGRSRRHEPSSAARDSALVVACAPWVIPAAIGRRFRIRALRRRRWLTTIVEPEPTPDSRVTLADTRDALGQRRARVTWRLTDSVYATADRAQEILGAELAKAGIGALELEPGATSRDNPLWCWHHIGTTRMSSNPRHGVVDTDCRLHGVPNVYVVGSSVFPTAGCDMPTLTLVALALRTADHIRATLPRSRGLRVSSIA